MLVSLKKYIEGKHPEGSRPHYNSLLRWIDNDEWPYSDPVERINGRYYVNVPDERPRSRRVSRVVNG